MNFNTLIQYIEIGLLLTVTYAVQDANEGSGSKEDKLRTNREQTENKLKTNSISERRFKHYLVKCHREKKVKVKNAIIVGQQCL